MATIRKRGGKWQVQIRRQGHPPVSCSFHTRADAQIWARQKELEADKGQLTFDPSALKRHTLGDLVKRYLATKTKAKKTAANETIVLNAFLRHPMCGKRLADLTSTDFASYAEARLQVVKPATLKRELVPIKNMFKVAREEWRLPLQESLLGTFQLKGTDNKRVRRIGEGELERLIRAAKSRKNPLVLPIILFALETAMRRGEILALRWDHVDLRRRSVSIPEAKNGHSRTIPLTPGAYALVQDIRRENERVFPTTANALRLSWDRLTKAAELEDLHFHDLRHEAVSRFFEMGLTAPEVASISGHRDMRMLMRYAHANAAVVQEKIARSVAIYEMDFQKSGVI